MPLFRYEAVDQDGRAVNAVMDADTEASVASRLQRRGYRLVRIEAGALPAPAPRPSASGARRRAGAAEIGLFFRQFAALTRAGISLYQALEDLGSRTPHTGLAEAAAGAAKAAYGGGCVSDSMADQPWLFPSHVVDAVRSGELGGFLPEVLDEIAGEYEQELAFYKGAWLPRALIIQEVIAVAAAQPLFPALFPNNDLPLYLRLLVFRNLPIAALVLLVVHWWWKWLHKPENRPRRDRIVLRIPVFGNLDRQKALAAFIRTLRRLYAAGLGPAQAWEGAMRVPGNAVIRARLAEAYELVRTGTPVHEAFARTDLFANEAEQLLATGVVSGQVVEMLDRVVEYYHANIDRALSASRFWMFRLAISTFIALSGAVLIIMMKTYFTAVFDFTKDWAQ